MRFHVKTEAVYGLEFDSPYEIQQLRWELLNMNFNKQKLPKLGKLQDALTMLDNPEYDAGDT